MVDLGAILGGLAGGIPQGMNQGYDLHSKYLSNQGNDLLGKALAQLYAPDASTPPGQQSQQAAQQGIPGIAPGVPPGPMPIGRPQQPQQPTPPPGQASQ